MVNIKGFDKAAVLAALHNGTKALGMGRMHDLGRPMTLAEAKMYIAESNGNLDFDYVFGRPLKVLSDRRPAMRSRWSLWLGAPTPVAKSPTTWRISGDETASTSVNAIDIWCEAPAKGKPKWWSIWADRGMQTLLVFGRLPADAESRRMLRDGIIRAGAIGVTL